MFILFWKTASGVVLTSVIGPKDLLDMALARDGNGGSANKAVIGRAVPPIGVTHWRAIPPRSGSRWKGVGMGRKLTDEQKAKRAVTRENNRRLKEAPLLMATGLLGQTTVAEERKRLKLQSAGRYRHAIDIASEAAEQLVMIEEGWLARLAKKYVPPEWYEHLWRYCHTTYPSVEYRLGFWKEVLLGVRHVLKVEVRFDPARANRINTDGRYLVDVLVWPPEGWSPLCRPEEWEAVVGPSYISRLTTKPYQPDDGGLWEKVQAAIDRAAIR